ncbi:MAG: hypothetical protein AAGC95_08190 [Pseudomonadota bacterium]
MSILHTPLGECLDVLEGAPYRIGDFEIWRRPHGFECIAKRLEGVAFIMPPDATLIDAQRYVTVFNAGFLAGFEAGREAPVPGAAASS